MVSYDSFLFMLKIETSTRETNSMPFLISGGIILWFTSGIISRWGSFAVKFGHQFQSGDDLRSGIVCGAIQ